MNSENTRPVSRKMVLGIAGAVALVLAGGILFAVTKLFKANEPDKQTPNASTQQPTNDIQVSVPLSVPSAGIVVEKKNVSKWVVSTVSIPYTLEDAHNPPRLSYFLADITENGPVFLWVQFGVSQTELPREIDVTKIRATTPDGVSIPVAGFGIVNPYAPPPTFWVPGVPFIDAMLAGEVIPQTVYRYSGRWLGVGDSPHVSSGSFESESIDYSYDRKEEKKATITIKKIPISFSILFIVPAGTKEIKITDLWDEPITVSVKNDETEADPGTLAFTEIRDLVESAGFHFAGCRFPAISGDATVWVYEDDNSKLVLFWRNASGEWSICPDDPNDIQVILRVAEKISKEVHDACYECADTYKRTREECSKVVGNYRVAANQHSISITIIPRQE